jgi:hypothetical protein
MIFHDIPHFLRIHIELVSWSLSADALAMALPVLAEDHVRIQRIFVDLGIPTGNSNPSSPFGATLHTCLGTPQKNLSNF